MTTDTTETVIVVEHAEDESPRPVARRKSGKRREPQDHKPKTVKPKVEREDDVYRITHRGVTVTVDVEALDDFELLDDIAAVEGGNGARLPSLLRRLIREDFTPLMDALRGESGRVKVEDAAEYIRDLFEAINPS